MQNVRYVFLALLATTILVGSAQAEDKAPVAQKQAGDSGHYEWTLTDARKHAHEYADKLDKMSEKEWAEHQKKRHEWKEKFSKMSPEEKESMKKKWRERREQKAHDAASASVSAKPKE